MSRPVPSWLNSELWRKSSEVNSKILSKITNLLSTSDEIVGTTSEAATNVSDTKDPLKASVHPESKSKIAEDKSRNFDGKGESYKTETTGNYAQNIPQSSSEGDPKGTKSLPNSEDVDAKKIERTSVVDEKKLNEERRKARLYTELGRKQIQKEEVRRLVSLGLPNEGSLRSTCWKLLLGYLPKNPEDWESELNEKRLQYSQFKEELIIHPNQISKKQEKNMGISERISQFDEAEEEKKKTWMEINRTQIQELDHPLNQGSESIWNQYFKDAEVAEQIDKDVQRTHPDISFFSIENKEASETQEVMKRILLLYAKLNPGIQYVQGMNEILAPLYFVFRTSTDPESSAHAEADAFFCFSALMGEFRDNYCKQLDNSMVGIRSTIANMAGILRVHDPKLWRHLEYVSKVNPQFYAFRWISLLLTQDFEFKIVLRLWDSLLANPDGPMEILLRICCAMLIQIRERLLAGDFTTNLKLLQNYPNVDTETLLKIAERLKV